MSDVYIDGEMLARVKQSFRSIETLLEQPTNDMRTVQGAAVGPPVLVSRVRDFGHEWGYGIEQLAEFSTGAVEALTSIEAAFEAADADLAQALTDAANEEG